MHSLQELLANAAAAKSEGRMEAAVRSLREAVELLRMLPERLELAMTLRSLGEVQRLLPDSDRGVAAYEEAVGIFRAEGEQRKLAHALRHLADIKRSLARGDEAVGHAEEALDIYAKSEAVAPLELANAFRSAALAQESCGAREEAVCRWREAERLYLAAGVAEGVEESRAHAGNAG